MIKQLFGFPVYQKNIDPKSYDKSKILDVILKNYTRSNKRNEWTRLNGLNEYESNNLHHSLEDENNKNFEKPNYDTLAKIYENEIKNYFDSLINQPYQFKFYFVNYTVMKKGSQMMRHIHNNCQFTTIHFLKLDENSKDTTVFHNTNDYAKFIKNMHPNLYETLNSNLIENSWIYKNYKLFTKEDDFFIFPAVTEHSVPIVHSDKKRITIVTNINIMKN